MVAYLFELSGKTAHITDSSRVISFGLAQGLAEAGARVIVNSRQRAAVDEAVTKLKDSGFDVRGAAFDVADQDSVATAFNAFDEQGLQIDILVNNAGVQHRAPMLELDLKDWQ